MFGNLWTKEIMEDFWKPSADRHGIDDLRFPINMYDRDGY